MNGFRNYTNERINNTMQKSQLLNVGNGVVIKRILQMKIKQI